MSYLQRYSRKNKVDIGLCKKGKDVVLCQVRACGEDISMTNMLCFEEEITSLSKEVFQSYNFKGNRLNVVITDEHIVQSYLELPYMNYKNTIKYIKYELNRLHKIDTNMYRFSYYVLGFKPNTKYKIQRVLAIGLSLSNMEQYIANFDKLGFRVVSFISPLDARLMVLRHIDDRMGKGATLCYVYIDESSVDILFYCQRHIISTASIKLPKMALDRELRSIFDYFHMEHYDKDIHSIILTGSCNESDKYIKFFKKQGFKTVWLDAKQLGFSSIVKGSSTLPVFYADALGAALYL